MHNKYFILIVYFRVKKYFNVITFSLKLSKELLTE
jgi:hypothetical protein